MASQLTGCLLDDLITECPYIQGNRFQSEQVLISKIDRDDLDTLLENGYRHFGTYFFRPICHGCQQCIPIRIVTEKYSVNRSHKRILRRNRNFRIVFEKGKPTWEKFQIYLEHKKRFDKKTDEDFDLFSQTFYHHYPFSYEMLILDRDKIFCVSHVDITGKSLSAIYCYYLKEYERFSPGTFSIIKEIEYAINHKLNFIYLGYYVPSNKHMNYKINFRPNQLHNGKHWYTYINGKGNYESTTPPAFFPGMRLFNSKTNRLPQKASLPSSYYIKTH